MYRESEIPNEKLIRVRLMNRNRPICVVFRLYYEFFRFSYLYSDWPILIQA